MVWLRSHSVVPKPVVLTFCAFIAIVALGIGLLYVLVSYRCQKIGILTDRHLSPAFDSAGESFASPTKVYLVGDSQIAHWPLDCRGDWHLYRSGFAGEATPNIASATRAFFSIAKPDAVVIMSGGNDVSAVSLLPPNEQKGAVARSLRAFGKLIEASSDIGAQHIFVFSIEPSRYNWFIRRLLLAQNGDEIRGEINSGIDKLCHGKCRVLYLRNILDIRSQSDWKKYLADAVHLNRPAYERLSESITRMLRNE